MALRLVIEGGAEEGDEGFATQELMRQQMERCLQLQARKSSTYVDAWRSQGWVGNVGRVLSKASRLRNMLWRDFPVDDGDEGVVDTLLDLVNLAVFAVINYNERNKWGS